MHTDLTTGSIHTHLISLSIPAMTGYFFHTMFNVTDTFFAGLISTQALAALSLTALVGNALGEKNTKEAQHITLKRYRYRDYCC